MAALLVVQPVVLMEQVVVLMEQLVGLMVQVVLRMVLVVSAVSAVLLTEKSNQLVTRSVFESFPAFSHYAKR